MMTIILATLLSATPPADRCSADLSRAEAGEAADVLRMMCEVMCEALLQDTQSESLTAEHWRVIVRGMAESALDQLAETGRR